jgi:hypothetical protein
VPHLHQHVIPRRTGDMPDPRGGVRHVIPGKGNYLITRDALLPHLEPDLSTGDLGTSSTSMPLSGILRT